MAQALPVFQAFLASTSDSSGPEVGADPDNDGGVFSDDETFTLLHDRRTSNRQIVQQAKEEALSVMRGLGYTPFILRTSFSLDLDRPVLG